MIYVSFTTVARTKVELDEIKGAFFIHSLKIKVRVNFLFLRKQFSQSRLALYTVLSLDNKLNFVDNVRR